MLDRVNATLRRLPNWAVYLLGAAPFVWLVWAAATNALGPDPVRAVENRLGLWGLQFLLATLAISPLRRLGVNAVKLRRPLGLIAFSYISLHFASWIGLDMALNWTQIATALWKRPYIVIGFAAFLAMIPLAVTSTNGWIKRLGPQGWQRLHRLTYAVGAAGAVHYLLLVKVWSAQPLIHAGVMVALLAIRLIPRQGFRRVAAR